MPDRKRKTVHGLTYRVHNFKTQIYKENKTFIPIYSREGRPGRNGGMNIRGENVASL